MLRKVNGSSLYSSTSRISSVHITRSFFWVCQCKLWDCKYRAYGNSEISFYFLRNFKISQKILRNLNKSQKFLRNLEISQKFLRNLEISQKFLRNLEISQRFPRKQTAGVICTSCSQGIRGVVVHREVRPRPSLDQENQRKTNAG